MNDNQLELQHIYLEANFQRWHSISRFFLPYYCYQNGFVTSQGKPSWEVARERCSASSNLAQRKDGLLVPMLPEEVLVGQIKALERDGELTVEALSELLGRQLHYVVITRSELGTLKKLGLEKSMPKEWYQSKQQPTSARLDTAGITLSQ
ncbi:hypothetical protein J4N42_06165 [Vibrio sp. SCSIO 43135]|uniref:hypothetical protein n=1 Tax=Vibrio sp. SCSIO 43135 TaxID=2819096 RepID=UPI002075271B|nr:hypothetical protein [Vibrio sp. SCSIO 43135]USD42302.1 hypothetical protein J4N42_06165 [Vibrio sp. SCSIO 43135]